MQINMLIPLYTHIHIYYTQMEFWGWCLLVFNRCSSCLLSIFILADCLLAARGWYVMFLRMVVSDTGSVFFRIFRFIEKISSQVFIVCSGWYPQRTINNKIKYVFRNANKTNLFFQDFLMYLIQQTFQSTGHHQVYYKYICQIILNSSSYTLMWFIFLLKCLFQF